jgi:hypothetical protein
MRGIYKHYKERLIEISGKSRSLFARKISKKYSYDIGKLLDGCYEEIDSFLNFLWKRKQDNYLLMGKKQSDLLYKNWGLESKIDENYKGVKANVRKDKIKRDEIKKVLANEISKLKNLKREIEEFARETGRYEMFIGYPFVTGALGNETVINAPLLLFPVVIEIENETVSIEMKRNERVQLNKVFILAYAKHYRVNIDELNLEFDSLTDYGLKNIDAVLNYLRKNGIGRISHSQRKGMFNFERGREPRLGDNLEIKYNAVLGRFTLANAIYNDYNILEKKKSTTPAITELLESKNAARIKNVNSNLYLISSLDYAQENAIESINRHGNTVIYGPPGTGKSQTIVNIITDSLCKGRKVLVISQKKAALDVVYNRLGVLNNKAMYVVNPEKDKMGVYERIKNAHLDMFNNTGTDVTAKYDRTDKNINKEMNLLQSLNDILFTPTAFGLSLQEMYVKSYLIGKNGLESRVYEAIKGNKELLALDYDTLCGAIRIIKEKRKSELYYKHIELQKDNPLVDRIRIDLDVHTINSAKTLIDKLLGKRIAPFDTGRYPNMRQLLAFYLENGIEDVERLRPIVKYIAAVENPKLDHAIQASITSVIGLILPYPILRAKMSGKVRQIEDNFVRTLQMVKEHTKQFEPLNAVLDKRGYAMLLGNIINGNMLFLELLGKALDNYIIIRDMQTNLTDMGHIEMMLLNFAYENSSNLDTFREIIDKLLVIRIYHEIVLNEERYKVRLSKIMDYENIRNRIASLKTEKEGVVREMCVNKSREEYVDLYNSDPENKNFFYQISKPQNLWPIRKLMEVYEDLLLELFPCWLLSPESVSTIMPLRKELFDLVLFDEASQIFIENAIPAMFRGKYIAIAGDNKQLRPTATFIKRYMGSDNDDVDSNMQVALEVESLLDLATARYNTAHLTYHYRSKSEELINFSNYAFYEGRLQVAPNITKNIGAKPIEVVKVPGRWIDNKNRAEALKVVELVKKIFKTRKDNETVGIITFNAEQESYIQDMLDAEAVKNITFRNSFLKECNRKENGEDVSLFVKNLENVQGDERDIIIFSIGYAQNEYGKTTAHFGPLNLEGGENRLNVAVTRAKKKIFVVTSIEPEELNVEGVKNIGPKLFKRYLQYARAVSNGRTREVQLILDNLKQVNTLPAAVSAEGFEDRLKAQLEKRGYTVDVNLGNTAYKLTLAIYDRDTDRYVLGVECDYSAKAASNSIMERDVFRAKFMESRGWKIIRVFSRDYFLNPNRVLNTIIRLVDRNRTKTTRKRTKKPNRAKKSGVR